MRHSFFKSQAYLLSLLAVAFSSVLLATSASQGSCSECMKNIASCPFSHLLFEIKTGYFFFSNPKMRKIYDRGGLDVQLSASYPSCILTKNWTLHAYAAAEYFHRSGKSLNGHQKTSVWSVPINIGFKNIYEINANTQCYFALGPRYFYLHQHARSPYVYKHKAGNGLGFFVNTGINYILYDHFVIDMFGEYSYATVHFRNRRPRIYTRNIEVGGFTFGGAFGYKF